MLLRNGTVVDGRATREADIRVEGGTIAAVGDLDAREDERVVALSDYALTPGLVDAHVHFSLSGEASVEDVVALSDSELALVEARNARRTLEAGITGVRAMGARGIDLDLARRVRAGDVPGPRVTANGHSLTVTGGHGHHLGREFDGPVEARRAVREEVKSGAGFIKFMTTGGVTTPGTDPEAVALTDDELDAIIDEAERQGVPTATHAHGAAGVKVAVQAGVETVEHGTFLDEEAIELMKREGATLVPTLSAPYHIVRNVESATADSARKTRDVYERHLESFEAAVAAGVDVAGGTDAGTPFNHHGANATEVEFMADHGLTEREALAAMTEGAAEVADLSGSGVIEPETPADLLVLAGDPLEDLSRLHDPVAVLKDGEVVSGSLPVEKSESDAGRQNRPAETSRQNRPAETSRQD